MGQSREWAIEEFGGAQLGDIRRRDRLVRMAERAAERPGGRITEVFETSADRQGAYDLLDNETVTPGAMIDSMGRAAARRCQQRALVSIDGSSLTLSDEGGATDFGAIGTYAAGARGLKVISALAIGVDGVPIGILHQEYWTRKERVPSEHLAKRKVKDKETQRWIDTIEESIERLAQEAPGVRGCILIDREGDNQHILRALQNTKADFIVRSHYNRRLWETGQLKLEDRSYMLDALSAVKAFEIYDIPIQGGSGRKARKARMRLTAAPCKIRLRDQWTDDTEPMEVWVVQTKEIQPPKGNKAIEWRLLTNTPVHDAEQARAIVDAYAKRWRIEEFHKSWKSSLCDIETSLLRSSSHAIKWASILAAVAARAERLKRMSRLAPSTPAARELSANELRALLLLKTKYRRSNEHISLRMKPRIEVAVRWIAELGGYTGKSSGGPPGTITISRGLERIRQAAELLDLLHSSGNL